MSTALLVVDMQTAFFRGCAGKSMEKASEYINEAVDLFRAGGKQVIWIQDEDEEDGNVRGTRGFEVIDLLKPGTDEKRFVKHYGNSFNKTGLAEYLRQFGIDTVIVTGYCAEACVLSTYRGALDYDLTPIILKNAIASGNEANKGFVENISDSITFKVLKKLINMA